MRLPRDLSGLELSKELRSLGYAVTRQTGSHIRMTTQLNGEHHLTVPAHDPLKVGTLRAILDSVARHHQMSLESVIRMVG